jgi:transcriptional regulator with XRE-family HTH domain
MHPADIQARLKKAGITQKQLADELGGTTMHVSEVVNKNRVSDRVMRSLAGRIGKSHLEVFPEYYFGPQKARHLESPSSLSDLPPY